MVALSRGYHRTDKLLSLILGDVSMRSDDSAFSVEHGPGIRRDTSGSQQHYREASIAAAAAAAAAAVQQHQQKQQQLLTQEHRLAELMQSGDQAPSGRIPPGAPTSITADARAMPPPAASSRSAGRPPHQRQQQPPHQPQPQQQPSPQPASADAPASPEDEPLRKHPHYRMLKEINRCVPSMVQAHWPCPACSAYLVKSSCCTVFLAATPLMQFGAVPSGSCKRGDVASRRGTHGFVQLALDTRTNTRMAIKFIPRDQKMQTKSVLRCARTRASLPDITALSSAGS
jgi:hypothetical protein